MSEPAFMEAIRLKASFLDDVRETAMFLASEDGARTVSGPERGFVFFVHKQLPSAPLFWVSPEMATLCVHAAKSMPNQPLRDTDLPSPTGFCYFGAPVAGISAVFWGVRDGGVWVQPLEAANRPMQAAFWKWGVSPNEFLEPGSVSHLGVEESREVSAEEGRHRFHSILTFWTLCQQRLAAPKSERAPRAARKFAERRHFDVSLIRVVRLRRQKAHTDEVLETGVDWTHRWMVNGHWRNQWLPSVKAHRLQWIAPYVKGPEDKPLVVKETVNAWVR